MGMFLYTFEMNQTKSKMNHIQNCICKRGAKKDYLFLVVYHKRNANLLFNVI